MPFALGLLALLALAIATRRRGPPAPPVDEYAPRESATGFDPTPKPGTKAFRAWAIRTWGERPGSPENIGRWDRTDKPSEHHEGRAWDLMTRDKAHGQAVVDALLAPDPTTGEPHALARRAGIMYLIWNKQMWRAYPWQGAPSGSWSPYSGASTHEDHVHFSFSRRGGEGETTLYQMI
jgi:hypothetical protein